MNSILMVSLHGMGRKVKDFIDMQSALLDTKIAADSEVKQSTNELHTCQIAEKQAAEAETRTRAVAKDKAADVEAATLDDDDARSSFFELKGIAETKVQEAEEFEDEDE